jgi:hypothetical protein
MTAPKPYQRKTDEEIGALAKRVYRNEVFVSWMINRQEDLPMVFMILMLLDEATRQRMIADNIQFLYEDYAEAVPRSVNGYPCFMSCKMLSAEDGHRLYERVMQIAEMVG